MKGVNIGGVNINNLRYADDTFLLAEGPMFLQALLTAVSYGMEMNISINQSINQSNFYSANIPGVARLSGATARSVSKCEVVETVR